MKQYLTRKESAEYLTERGLKTSPLTLQKYASVGGGPQYQVFGNRAVYRSENLDAWAEARLGKPRHSTSNAA